MRAMGMGVNEGVNSVAVQRSTRVQAGVSHRQFLALALPLVGSALAPPLLGAVDTAVMGRMPDPAYIGGVAVGSLIFNTLYWLFGFLQMGTVGFAAQAYGSDEKAELRPRQPRPVHPHRVPAGQLCGVHSAGRGTGQNGAGG